MSTKTKNIAHELRRVKERKFLSSRDLIISVSALLIMGLMATTAIASEKIAGQDQMLPGTSIAGVNVGGLDQTAAQEKLQAAAKDFLKQDFVFTYQKGKDKKTFKAKGDDFGLTIDTAESIRQAYRLGHADNFFSNIKAQLISTSAGFREPLYYDIDQTALKAFLDTAFLQIEKPAKQATLEYKDARLLEIAGVPGQEVDRGQIKQALTNQVKNLKHEPAVIALKKTQPQITKKDLKIVKELANLALDTDFTYTYDNKEYRVPRETLADWMEFRATLPENVLGKSICDCGLPTTLTTKNGRAQQVPSLLITPFDQERLGQKTSDPYYVMVPPENFSRQPFINGQLLPVFGFNRDKVNHWLLTNIAASIDRPGQNARLTFIGGKVKVTSPSVNGVKVDVEKAARDLVFKILNDKSSQQTKTPNVRARLQLAEAKPAINEEIIDKLGIKTLIGRGVSDFSGSPPNRVHNINVGFEKYSGLVIPPGEEFSVVEKLGPVDAAAGFLPELVIVGKKITPQYGGGLCQVSTTIFRAALDTGLPITERTNHSFAVSYYKWPYPEWGVEATIYDPAPDLKFKNNTDHYILIQAYTKGGKAYVDFYGTDPKRTTTIEGPWRLSGSMVGGGTTTFNYIVKDDATGKTIRKQTFVSVFQALKNFKHE